MADNYVLRVTAGPTYDLASHKEVAVNTPKSTHVSSDSIDADVTVRVQDFHGLPRNSPTTSPYFDQPPHAYNKDQYSISLQFTPKAPAQGGDAKGISGANLQFGNDFEHSIANRLPPGFNTALSIVKWWIDPGLDGDPYADQPYLYGPALSSFNTIRVGTGSQDSGKGGLVVEEGGDEAGTKEREAWGVPTDSKSRMKWALKPESKEKWVWEYGKTYSVDFFNPYISFSDCTLRLPGFHVQIMKYWDGSQALRYVLRRKDTEELLLVVQFTLYRKENVNEDGTLKPEAHENQLPEGEKAAAGAIEHKEGDFDHDKALEEAKKHLSSENLVSTGKQDTSADDLD